MDEGNLEQYLNMKLIRKGGDGVGEEADDVQLIKKKQNLRKGL